MVALWLVVAGLLVGAIVLLATGGRVVFLPLVFLFPLIGIWGGRRSGRGR
jgi:hypothetical protein